MGGIILEKNEHEGEAMHQETPALNSSDSVQDKKRIYKELWDWGKAIGVAVILAILIRTFLFSPTIVDGESMMTTLKDGEFLIVNKFVYRVGAPKHGDIVTFHATEKKDYIKRVVGVAGDRIVMKDDQLYINGVQMDEPYLHDSIAYWHELEGTPFTEDFFVDEIPDGTIYVLGDNRRSSRDSRIIGPIPLDRVIGRADVSIWPIPTFRLLK